MSLLNDLQGMYNPNSKTLSLDTGKLGALGASLLTSTGSSKIDFGGVQSLPAESAGTISFQGSSLQFSGDHPRLSFPPGKVSLVSCNIYQADTNPVLVISIKLVAAWQFPDSLPWLTGTFWAALALKPGILDAPGTLLLSTGQIHEPTLGIDLSEGVAFYGALDEAKGLLNPASWILGSAPKAFGPMTLHDSAPPAISLELIIANAQDGFAGLFKDLQVPLEAQLIFQPDSVASVDGLHLIATLSWVGQPAKLEAFLPGLGTSVVELSLDGPLPLPTPDDLTRYLGGSSVTQYLPAEFSKALNSIHVGNVTLGIGLGSKKLEYARVVLTTLEDSTFTIVPKWVTISDISFSVAVFFGASGISSSYSLSGKLDIGGVDLLVSASLVPTPQTPDLTVIVQLDELDVIDLTMIATKFGLPAGAPQILVDEFQMGASTAGTFFIRTSLSEHPVGPEQSGFVMSALIFELDYDGTQPNLNLEGVMEIAGVTATLSLSNQEGWVIQGEAGEDQPIKIGALIADLGTKFGVQVPAPIQSLALKKLEFKYWTGTGRFFFTCEGDFTVSSTPVAITVTVDVTPQQALGNANAPAQYDSKFGGEIKIGPLVFNLKFNIADKSSQTFIATYSHAEGDASSVSIHDLVAAISTDLAAGIPADLKIDLKDVKFIFYQQDQTKQFAFGLDLSASMSLADLPLVGSKLPADQTIAIKALQFMYSSTQFTTTQVGVINPLLPSTVSPLPASLPPGINISADLYLGADKQTISLADTNQPSQTALTPAQPAIAPSQAGGSTSTTKWFDVQKQFGIFQFKRIGIQYQSGILLFALDAAMDLGPLTFSMDGLSIGSPLSEFKPVFDLSGLGLSYVKPPLEITGALLKLPGAQLAPDTQFQFDGMVVVKAEQYSLAAIGSYAQLKSGDPSLFVFAQLEAALGGPPAFFVTGLMAGFGFNRMLTIPAQDEVLDFPLLLLAQPPEPGGQAQKQDPMHVLDILEGRAPVNGKTKAWIAPQPGDYWLAVGLEFMSFELVRSKALLIVEFGNDLTIALLGLSTLQLPQPEESSQTYAYVEMQLRVVLKPQEGSFAATAILSKNSYVISPDCRLTGGFAFYLWFGPNEHAGDFVITLGGYHPAFKPPSHFPIVPRLGFNWAVSDVVSIKGEAYFALTNSCIMAGGGLQVLFHDGDLQAWFTAQADLLVSWRPFFYLANIDVSIGVSYRLNFLGCHKTLSVSVGASLDLWGPPTGGRVHVNIVVLTFTISFGSDSASQNRNPLLWPDFKTLLPAADSVCRITVSSGLYKTQDSDKDSSGKLWIVRAKNFSFFTQSAIPASHLQYGAALQAGPEVNAGSEANKAPTINIRPMNLTGVTSTHTLKIFKGDTSTPPVDVSKWTLTPRTLNVPESLWGAPPDPFTQIPNRPTANVVPNQMVGYTVQAPPPDPGDSRGLIPLTVLLEEYIKPAGAAPFSPAVSKVPRYVPTFSDQTVGQIQQIMSTTVKQNRDTLYAILGKAGIYSGDNGSVSDLASDAGHLYSDSPMQQS